jgi:hypothetical protein
MGALADLNMGAGAGAGLEQYFQRILLERQQAERERAIRVQEAQVAQNAEDMKAYRQDQLAANADARAERTRAAQESEKIRRINLFLQQPAGTEQDPASYDYAVKELGVPKGYFDTATPKAGFLDQTTGQAGAEGPVAVPQIRFRGTEKDAADAANRDQRDWLQQQRLDSQAALAQEANRSREMIAAMNAAAKGNAPQRMYPGKWLGEDGTPMTGGRYSDGTIAWETPDPLGQAAQKEQRDNQQLLTQIDHVLAVGKEINWRGVGPFLKGSGSAKETLSQYGMNFDKQAEDLRSSLSSMVADIAHGKYGSALTPTEVARLMTFAPDISIPGEVNEVKLNVMRRAIAHRLQMLDRGHKLADLEISDPLDLSEGLPSQTGSAGQPIGQQPAAGQLNRYGAVTQTPGVPGGGQFQTNGGAMGGVKVYSVGDDPNNIRRR